MGLDLPLFSHDKGGRAVLLVCKQLNTLQKRADDTAVRERESEPEEQRCSQGDHRNTLPPNPRLCGVRGEKDAVHTHKDILGFQFKRRRRKLQYAGRHHLF